MPVSEAVVYSLRSYHMPQSLVISRGVILGFCLMDNVNNDKSTQSYGGICF